MKIPKQYKAEAKNLIKKRAREIGVSKKALLKAMKRNKKNEAKNSGILSVS